MALLCVDWVAPHGPWDDLLVFVFDGGVLTLEEAADIHPVDDEITDVGFFTHTEAQNRLRDDI